MNYFGKLTLSLPALFVFSILAISMPIAAQEILSPQAIYLNEKRTIAALQTVFSAQTTYQTTTGAGNFGTFAQLYEAGLIDELLASGDKHGYRFAMTVQNYAPNSPATFQAVAAPRGYRKTGRRSFFIGSQNALIRGADKQGAAATADDPIIPEYYSCDSEADCETKAVRSVYTIFSAELTYLATHGNGRSFASICRLNEVGLIDEVLADNSAFGYYFIVTMRAAANSESPAFEIIAVPRRYPNTGRRSFLVDESGILRGADKNGAPASADDPIIKN